MDIKSIAGEFKAFILKGNVVDLAVGVVIGASFKSVVDTLVASVINPILVLFHLLPGGSALSFASLVQSIISFAAIALVVFFLVVKPMNLLMAMTKKKAEEQPEAAPLPEDVKLLMEIRDLLKAGQASTASEPKV